MKQGKVARSFNESLLCLAAFCCLWGGCERGERNSPPTVKVASDLSQSWGQWADHRKGKVVFARPPVMVVLDLGLGSEKIVPGLRTEGGAGRKERGKTPRPSWSPDGSFFIYRYQGSLWVCDESGIRREIRHPVMDCSDETRWSCTQRDGDDWVVGPTKKGNVVLVGVNDCSRILMAFTGGAVVKHCDLCGTGRYVVYDDGRDVRVVPFGTHQAGRVVSFGQSCRPCAAPDDRVAWLHESHRFYLIHDARTGRQVGVLKAPDGEEIYRMNWSNHPDWAVHMYGSEGNARMHVRRISTGEALYIGTGWDPDLWIGAPERPRS